MTFFQFLGACTRLLWGCVRVTLHVTYIICWKRDYNRHTLVVVQDDKASTILLGCSCKRLYYINPSEGRLIDGLLALASSHIIIQELDTKGTMYPKGLGFREISDKDRETEEQRRQNREGKGKFLGSVRIHPTVIEFFDTEVDKKPATIPMPQKENYNSYTTGPFNPLNT
jgi:hypothetical protein